ncbi:MAG: hypothetical protein ACM32E_09575, partial [Gemmatimonadota bacterium]
MKFTHIEWMIAAGHTAASKETPSPPNSRAGSDTRGPADRKRPLLGHEVAERAAVDEFHDQVQAAIVGAGVEDGRHAGMHEPG